MKIKKCYFAAIIVLETISRTLNIANATEFLDIISNPNRRLINNSRLLENADDEIDYSSQIIQYSLKFQGCHHVYSYNADADGDEDVRIYKQRMARYRLCPSNKCSSISGGGCKSGYGDYIVDMEEYLGAYLESIEKEKETVCENASYDCKCDDQFYEDDDANQLDDNFEYNCEYSCFKKKNLSYCLEQLEEEAKRDNDDYDDRQEFRLEKYSECSELEMPENDDDGNNGGDDDAEEIQYYVGPYCANKGGSIYLGLFTDDTCTVFADSKKGANMFKTLMGYELPYKATSLVGSDCRSCIEPIRAEEEAEADDYYENEDEISRGCEELYETSGKCESYMDVEYKNEDACAYIDGIKIIRMDGLVGINNGEGSIAAGFAIAALSLCFGMIGAYAYFLYKKIKYNINLN